MSLFDTRTVISHSKLPEIILFDASDFNPSFGLVHILYSVAHQVLEYLHYAGRFAENFG